MVNNRHRQFWIWGVFILSCVATALLYLFNWNHAVFHAVNGTRSVLGPLPAAALTILGDGLIVAVLILPFIRVRRDVLWSLFWAALIWTLMVHILKQSLDVPRPPRVLDAESFILIGRKRGAHAFPSGHTATIFGFAGVWVFRLKKINVSFVLLVLAILVGLSRIAVGVHWPADVAAGAAIGWISAYAGILLEDRLKWSRFNGPALWIGILLLISAVVLLISYDTGYREVEALRYAVGAVCFVLGLVEWIRLFRESRAEKTV